MVEYWVNMQTMGEVGTNFDVCAGQAEKIAELEPLIEGAEASYLRFELEQWQIFKWRKCGFPGTLTILVSNI